MNKFIWLFLFFGILSLTGCGDPELVMTADSTGQVAESSETIGDSKQVSFGEKIYVYVCGYVTNPGVYALSSEARICDAIEAAGGVTEGSNQEALSQAEHMTDGQTIYVPGMEEMKQKESEDGLLNLNDATKEELMTLPGIGESKADIIIEYRQEHGPFGKIEDLMNIPGIKEGVFNKIKDAIKVSG